MSPRPDARLPATSVVMIRPASFGGNAETASTNRFQSAVPASAGRGPGAADAAAHVDAQRAFDAVVDALERCGVDVRVFAGNADATLPDEVFGNNWISTHPDGSVVLYPLLAANRRPERRADVVEWLHAASGRTVTRVIDLSHLETAGDYLEGTGSLVIDHERAVAYCCRSARTTPGGIRAFAAATGITAFEFEATDSSGAAIYHTNVMLSLAPDFAVVCLEAVDDADRRMALAASLEETGREIVAIRREQMHAFAANILALGSAQGPLVAMSERALGAFDGAGRRRLEAHGALVAVDIDPIERLGGGSLRCMLTENLLPRAGNVAAGRTGGGDAQGKPAPAMPQ